MLSLNSFYITFQINKIKNDCKISLIMKHLVFKQDYKNVMLVVRVCMWT